jgi:hypothetical protein
MLVMYDINIIYNTSRENRTPMFSSEVRKSTINLAMRETEDYPRNNIHSLSRKNVLL